MISTTWREWVTMLCALVQLGVLLYVARRTVGLQAIAAVALVASSGCAARQAGEVEAQVFAVMLQGRCWLRVEVPSRQWALYYVTDSHKPCAEQAPGDLASPGHAPARGRQ